MKSARIKKIQSFWKKCRLLQILVYTTFYTFFLVLLGLVLIRLAFGYLQQDAFIHYYSSDFDEMKFSANATLSRWEGGDFDWNQFFIRSPFLARSSGYLSLEIAGHSLVVDGIELPNSYTNERPISQTYFFTLNFNKNEQVSIDFHFARNEDQAPIMETFNSFVRITNLGNSRFIDMDTDELTWRWVWHGDTSLTISNGHSVTILDARGEKLFNAQPVTNINLYVQRMTVTSSDGDVLQVSKFFDERLHSIRGSINNIEILRSSGELTFFQAANVTTHIPIHQDLFFEAGTPQLSYEILAMLHPGLRMSGYYDPLNFSFLQEEDSLIIHGMVEDARISGFSIVPHFRSWLYDNFTVVTTSLLTSIFGAFGGAHLYYKHKEKSFNHAIPRVGRKRIRRSNRKDIRIR